MKKIGFIGCGKMASAIIKGIIGSGLANADDIIASKSSPNNLETLSKDLGIKIVLSNKEVTDFSDIVFIAVKPNQIESILNEIKQYPIQNKLIVSVAAGITTKFIENIIPNTPVIRVMPNTPVLVNEGMAGINKGQWASDNDLEEVLGIFNSIGRSIVVEESQMDIVTAISGSGPAFFYKIINDIARAGEKLGLDYEKALLLSIQTAIGSSKMALNRSIPMENLIENVATKGGCTRVGVDIMDKYNTDNLFLEVIDQTKEKACELGK